MSLTHICVRKTFGWKTKRRFMYMRIWVNVDITKDINKILLLHNIKNIAPQPGTKPSYKSLCNM